MIDFLAAITVALAMFGIMGMVLIPASSTRSRPRGVDQRATLVQWYSKYLGAPRTRG